jgi:hypothetical protein
LAFSRADPSAEHWLGLITGGADNGNRNTQTTRLAGYLLRNSWLDPRVVHGLVQCWNVATCKPPLDPDEVTKIVNSIAGRELRRLGKSQRCWVALGLVQWRLIPAAVPLWCSRSRVHISTL